MGKDPEDHLSRFVSRIRTFIWLDGGHNNGEQTMIWPTDENLISTLEQSHIRTEIYVTPFQINPKNPYKKFHTEQYQKFSDILRCQSRNLSTNKMLFSDDSPSIDKHFELLTVF